MLMGEIFSKECCKKGDSRSWEAHSTQDETACMGRLESLVTTNRNVKKETKCYYRNKLLAELQFCSSCPFSP